VRQFLDPVDFGLSADLSPTECVRRLLPPFPEARQELAWQGKPLTRAASAACVLALRKGELDLVAVSYCTSLPNTTPLKPLIAWISGIGAAAIEGRECLLDAAVAGDFIFDGQASAGQRLAALEPLLTAALGHRVHLTRVERERPVYLATGSPSYGPAEIQVRSSAAGSAYPCGGGSGDGGRFLADLSTFINHEIVYRPPQTGAAPVLRWRLYRASRCSHPVFDGDAITRLLNHVSEQTGITFEEQRRPVQVVLVE
jgi:hypothetical protein